MKHSISCRSATGRLSVIAIAAAMLGGCAGNPIVRWTPPEQPRHETAGTLDHARAYAAVARSAYQDAISQQVKATADLSNVLLGTGALVAALAAGKVHRDAIVGTSFIGGTTYAFGQMNLNRQRLLVYQAGVEAINCANRAVAPFGMRPSEATALDTALHSVDELRARIASERKQVMTLIDAVPEFSDSEPVNAARRAAARSVEVETAANDALVAGRKFASAVQRAGDELILAVDRIDAAVVRATLDTLPDLSAVPKIVAGLAGMAGSFAPGAGVETIISERLAEAAKARSSAIRSVKGDAPDKRITDLEAATARLDETTALAARAIADVRSRTAGRDAALAPDAFKDCGVSEVSFPLAAAPASLQFALGANSTRSLLISGGTKPYLVEVDGTPVAGITVKQPAPFETRATVSVDQSVTAPVTVSLLIVDSSSPARTRTVVVSVGENKASGETGGADPAPQTEGAARSATIRPAAIDKLADRINGVGSFKVKSVTFSANGSAKRKRADTIGVTLSCDVNSAAPPRKGDVRAGLLRKLGVKEEALPAKLEIAYAESCARD